MPRALITGITGQDGSYLADFLIGKGYEVHGLVRTTTQLQHSRLSHLCNDLGTLNRQLIIHRFDLSDSANLRRILTEVAPEEVYHLASQSQVGLSLKEPEPTCEVTALGTLRLLEIIRNLPSPLRFFHASS